jgi:hypothetical protein
MTPRPVRTSGPVPLLTANQVNDIRRRISRGEQGSALATEYKLSAVAIHKLFWAKTYRWVPFQEGHPAYRSVPKDDNPTPCHHHRLERVFDPHGKPVCMASTQYLYTCVDCNQGHWVRL